MPARVILVMFSLLLSGFCITSASPAPQSIEAVQDSSEIADSSGTNTSEKDIEPIPILMYDTDVGVGAGFKVKFLHYIQKNASFDFLVFASTKGERWAYFIYSSFDHDLRQGTKYQIAIDVGTDYDKMIHNRFFGVGNTSRFDDVEYYTKEPLKFSISASRGFTPVMVGKVGLQYLHIWSSNFDEHGQLVNDPRNALNSYAASGLLSFGFDSRDGYIRPTSGFVATVELEYAPPLTDRSTSFTRSSLWLQYYKSYFGSGLTIAMRWGLQSLFGNDIPIQFLLPIGGNRTVRGLPQDRYLDKTSSVANIELRIPLVWKFEGMLGVDAGKVWASLSDLDFKNWPVTPTIGLRFYFELYVVRLDVGFSRETMGLYFNFGHVF